MSKAAKRQRKKELHRARIEAQIKRYRARRRRRLSIYLGVLGVAIALLVGLIVDARRDESRTDTELSDCASTVPERAEIALLTGPPAMSIDQAKTYTAVMDTSCGEIRVELADDTSPQTVNSFVSLARMGFYNGLTFHRVIEYAVQGGDPAGDGSGSPGYEIVEAPPPLTTYERGTVAMAKGSTDPAGNSGSQFFIVSQDATQLNGTPESPAGYAILGRVTEGLEGVDKIGMTETISPSGGGEKSRPRKDIYILKITIEES